MKPALEQANDRPLQWETHTVTNQPPPLADVNLYAADLPLRDAVKGHELEWAEQQLSEYGALAGGPLAVAGELANRHQPEFQSHDRYGHRLDRVDFHPSYHTLMDSGIRHQLHSLTWVQDREGTQRVRSLLMYLHNQADAGTMCPLTMTHASIPVLLGQGDVGEPFARRVLSAEYDPAFRPWWEKRGLTVGMGMTEKQGGSDVRSNTTRAVPTDNGWYSLTGHKWFFSAPMCDLFLVLAQAPEGLSCFLLPRWRRDGSLNAIRIQRLKHKLGNHSNASSEVEFEDAEAALIGPAGRGIPTIIDMVAQTRLDCMIGSASLMRQALSQALHHARHRSAFGKPLIEQPLMGNVLADLALESEAALLMMLRVAKAMEQAQQNDSEAVLARLGTAIGKFWICKRAPAMINEAQECLGGAGYVEDSILPRLYREAPVNSIWEGSGNVQCLDVLRALEKQPGAMDALHGELGTAAGMNADYDLWLQRIGGRLGRPEELQYRARSVVEELAVGLQACELLRSGLETEAELFCRSRLVDRHLCYGTLPTTRNLTRLLERAALQTGPTGT